LGGVLFVTDKGVPMIVFAIATDAWCSGWCGEAAAGVAMAAAAFFVSTFAWGMLILVVEQITLSNRLDIDPPRTRMTDAMSCGF